MSDQSTHDQPRDPSKCKATAETSWMTRHRVDPMEVARKGAKPLLNCDNDTRPHGAGNTERPLTRPSDLTREGLPMNGTRTCTIDGCEKPCLARGWCSAHWSRWKRHGDPTGGGIPRQSMPERCASADDCTNPPFARGMCATHWRRDKAERDPEGYGQHLGQRREWHAANSDKVAEVRRRSYERNTDRIAARMATWRDENRDVILLNNWQRRRREYGLPENVAEIVHPEVVFTRDQGHCQICLLEVNPDLPWPEPASATIDHVIPACDLESEHSYANVALAHWGCNRRKSWTRERGN